MGRKAAIRKDSSSGSAAVQRRRVRLHPARRREQLLEAVEAVVSESGYQGATVPRIVARAGVAQGSFYRYFRDIDDAMLELMQRALAPVARAAAGLDFSRVQNATDLRGELLRFYRVLARELVAHPALIREALMVAPAARGNLGTAMSAFLGSMRETALQLIEMHAGRSPFRAIADPGAAAGAVVGMILGAAQQAVGRGEGFDTERWANEMARFEAGALLNPPAASRPSWPGTRR
jgi:AcrR family transcriptional regulator